MKVKVLIKDTVKDDNILSIIKQNPNLKESQDLVTFYNEKNWHETFTQAVADFRKGKFRRFVIIDDYAYGPFLFLSKQKGLLGTSAFDEYSANLIRAHNNTKVCIIPVKRINPNEKLNNIINAFLVSNFDAGRHVTRLQILHASFDQASAPINFSKTPNKTVVIASDHAAYALKEAVKEHLIQKGYQIIDVGTNSFDSTHYSMYGIALAKHIPEASYAIACCWTGMGISNTVNKFKGLRACVCKSPEDAKVACSEYGCNVLTLGSKFLTRDMALKTVDEYLATKQKTSAPYKVIDDYGFKFDKMRFHDIKLEKGIVVPRELN